MEREQAFLQLGQVDSCYVYHLNSLHCYLFPVEHLNAVIRKLDDSTSHCSYVTFSISVITKRPRNEYIKGVDHNDQW